MIAVSSASNERLQHSADGLRRLAQMEGAQVHIYVEGKNGDRYYYSKALQAVRKSRGVDIDFHLSRDIRGSGEGKLKCLGFHDFLQESNSLISRLDGKCTVNCFFLDKDIDDLMGLLRNSEHILYTTDYCIENHIVSDSDLSGALSAATGTDIGVAGDLIPDQTAWIDGACDLWQEWVALCIFARTSACGIANYKRLSRVNVPLDQPADTSRLFEFIKQVGERLALTIEESEREYLRSLDIVIEHRQRNERGKLYKGRWFAAMLAELGKKAGLHVDEKLLWGTLCSYVNPDLPSSDVVREFVLGLVDLCQNLTGQDEVVPPDF